MEPQEIFERLNPEERLILYAVGALDRPLRSKVKLQKLLFLVSNVFSEIDDLLQYEGHFLGPYSEIVENLAQQLETQGLIEKDDDGYHLTHLGQGVFSNIRPAPQLVSVMDDFKEMLNDLKDDDIMTFIYACYPAYVTESLKWDELKRNRRTVAISLLNKGKLSVGRAAEVAGMSEPDFIDLIEKRRIG